MRGCAKFRWKRRCAADTIIINAKASSLADEAFAFFCPFSDKIAAKRLTAGKCNPLILTVFPLRIALATNILSVVRLCAEWFFSYFYIYRENSNYKTFLLCSDLFLLRLGFSTAPPCRYVRRRLYPPPFLSGTEFSPCGVFIVPQHFRCCQ